MRLRFGGSRNEFETQRVNFRVCTGVRRSGVRSKMTNKPWGCLILFILAFLIFVSCTSSAYRGNSWYSPGRSNYGGGFRGGGPSWGK
jgi:uncharacterized membrane protein YgcG